MKIEDWDKLAEIIKVIKEKKLIPDKIEIDDYSGDVRLHIIFNKKENK